HYHDPGSHVLPGIGLVLTGTHILLGQAFLPSLKKFTAPFPIANCALGLIMTFPILIREFEIHQGGK
ncbi:MAG: hypothetical protein IIZ01_00920, partial [Aeriscardovia sp.]|nr:hypothetical protein [Aeriscardovia sp.]